VKGHNLVPIFYYVGVFPMDEGGAAALLFRPVALLPLVIFLPRTKVATLARVSWLISADTHRLFPSFLPLSLFFFLSFLPFILLS